MQAKNFLFILSDQHHRLFSGAYGHPTAQTPHLDALAARGTRFQNAYTNCPICVPERASYHGPLRASNRLLGQRTPV